MDKIYGNYFVIFIVGAFIGSILMGLYWLPTCWIGSQCEQPIVCIEKSVEDTGDIAKADCFTLNGYCVRPTPLYHITAEPEEDLNIGINGNSISSNRIFTTAKLPCDINVFNPSLVEEDVNKWTFSFDFNEFQISSIFVNSISFMKSSYDLNADLSNSNTYCLNFKYNAVVRLVSGKRFEFFNVTDENRPKLLTITPSGTVENKELAGEPLTTFQVGVKPEPRPERK